ncbi:MAG: DUF1552 domain-containing protein [bacterium]|nr:DUF1552 domain-containing protein [bacterium]
MMGLVLDDARSLATYVSQADRHRLDEYFHSIRALEKRIEFSEKHSRRLRDDKALSDTLTTPKPGIPAERPWPRYAPRRPLSRTRQAHEPRQHPSGSPPTHGFEDRQVRHQRRPAQ